VGVWLCCSESRTEKEKLQAQETVYEKKLRPDLNTAFWQVIDIEGKIAKFEMAWHYTCSDVVVFPDFQASSNIQYTRGRFVPK
jgi:hypothetical protein